MNAEDFFDEGTALDLGSAISNSDLPSVKKMAASMDKVILNQIHKKDMTFLHFAFLKQDVEVMKSLVQSGASPHIDIANIGSVISLAVKAKETKYLRALLEVGVSPNSTDRWEMPIFFAATTKNDDCKTLRIFAEHGADFDLQSSTGRTAVMHAFTSLAYDESEYLIEHGVNLETNMSNGVTLAYLLELELEQQKKNPGTAAYKKLVQLQNLMTQRGVRFPATSPEQLR